MEEDCKMNKYLALENLPKAIEEAKQSIKDLNKVLGEPHLSEKDFSRLDNEIKELSDVTAKLAEKRLLKNNSGDDKLALFRQQATIISRKKEGTAQRLNVLTENVIKLKEEVEKKEDLLKNTSGNKVSEKKAEVDEAKGRTLNEISDIIQTLMTTINDKKALLAPVIQELRSLRAKAADVEADYLEKKKVYDATMVVLQEMKAYIGGDDVIELQQKARGFKTYRDLYNRKLVEQENLGKSLRDQQKDIKVDSLLGLNLTMVGEI
ncbi:Intraflagellar transport protein 81 [Phlyctochytrium bullatum]|nr:Intraflagellar transport protein 81 [Phlyctochytrium bullatum]